jgi:hypothetical protein
MVTDTPPWPWTALPSDDQFLAEASELGSDEESGDFGDEY